MSERTFLLEIKKIVKLLPTQLISSKVFFWTYPLSLGVAGFIAPIDIANFQEFSIWILIGFLSHTAMFPFVIYGKEGKSLSLQVVLVIAMGIVRGAVIGLMAPILGVEDSLPVMARVLNSALAVFYWNQAGAIIVEYGASFRSRVKSILSEILEKKIVGMPEAAKASSHQLITVIGHLQEKIVSAVGQNPNSEDLKRASEEIDSLISTHIRPLSQSTWRDGELTTIRAGIFAVMKRVLSNQVIPVVGVIVLSLPFTLVAQTTRIGFLSTILVQGIWLTVTFGVYKFVYRRVTPANTYASNLRFLSLILLISYPITFVAQTVFPLSDSSSLGQMIQGYFISATSQIALFIVGALLISLYDDQEFAFQFLREVIHKGELDSLLEKTRSGNDDVNFAQYVHAEVQSQLLACKLLLLKAAESDFELFPPEITQQIVERMEKIKQPYHRPAARIPALRVAELSQSWQGLAEITYDLIPELRELSAHSDVTSQLIEEAVVNSIRHGGAKKIHISSSRAGATLEVVVTDDGEDKSISQGSGLGTILFETFASSWSLNRKDDSTQLVFTIDTSAKGKTS